MHVSWTQVHNEKFNFSLPTQSSCLVLSYKGWNHCERTGFTYYLSQFNVCTTTAVLTAPLVTRWHPSTVWGCFIQPTPQCGRLFGSRFAAQSWTTYSSRPPTDTCCDECEAACLNHSSPACWWGDPSRQQQQDSWQMMLPTQNKQWKCMFLQTTEMLKLSVSSGADFNDMMRQRGRV